MKPKENTVRGIKAFLKDLAIAIRISKILRKEERNQTLSGYTDDQIAKAVTCPWKLVGLRDEYRSYHIAYCEFRGKTRTQIEAKTNTEPNESLIQSIKMDMVAAHEALEKARLSEVKDAA